MIVIETELSTLLSALFIVNITTFSLLLVHLIFIKMDPEEFKQSKMEKNYKVYKRGNRHPRTETKNAEESSGEEDHTPRRQRVRRTPRSKNNTPRDHGGPMPAPSALLPVKSIGQVTSIMGLSGDSTSRTLISSPTGQSFNRKSLREISRKEINELRASMVRKYKL